MIPTFNHLGAREARWARAYWRYLNGWQPLPPFDALPALTRLDIKREVRLTIARAPAKAGPKGELIKWPHKRPLNRSQNGP